MTGDLEETFNVSPLTEICLATLIFRKLRDIRTESFFNRCERLPGDFV